MWEYEAASSRGQRPYQEDRVLAVVSRGYGLFAAFDGHRGCEASDFALACFYQRFLHHLQLNRAIKNQEGDTALLRRVLWSSVWDIEDELIRNGVVSGTTACIAVVSGESVVVANVGDSRAIVCGREGSFVQLSREHHACAPDERARIESAGGKIAENGRLFGQFEASRALGDSDIKRYGMSAEPEFMELRVQSSDLFLVVASDGVFEKLKVDDVCGVVHSCGGCIVTKNDVATPLLALQRSLPKIRYEHPNNGGTKNVTLNGRC